MAAAVALCALSTVVDSTVLVPTSGPSELVSSPLAAVSVTPLLDARTCDAFIADAEASAVGWRSVLRYETLEVPLDEVASARAWFDSAGREELWRIIRAHHLPPVTAASPSLQLQLDESNIIKYSAAEGGARAVRAHTDGDGVLTFNVLLSDPSDFGGGTDASDAAAPTAGVGTRFAHLANATVRPPARGHALVYYGGQVHSSGAALERGVRYVWQGFVSVRVEPPAPDASGADVHAAAGHGPRAGEERAAHAAWEHTAAELARAAFEAEVLRVAPHLARAGVEASAEDATLLANLCAALGRAAQHAQEEARARGGAAPAEAAEARAACRRALELGPSAGAHNNLGLLLASGGEREAAEASFRSGIALARRALDDAPAAGADGACPAAGAGEHSARPPLGSAAASRMPELAELHTNLCALLLHAEDGHDSRAEEAVRECAAAVQLAPETASMHANLGAALRSAGDDARARDALERALQIEPTAAGARFNLAVLLLNAGAFARAEAHFAALVEAHPHDEDARQGLAIARARAAR